MLLSGVILLIVSDGPEEPFAWLIKPSPMPKLLNLPPLLRGLAPADDLRRPLLSDLSSDFLLCRELCLRVEPLLLSARLRGEKRPTNSSFSTWKFLL